MSNARASYTVEEHVIKVDPKYKEFVDGLLPKYTINATLECSEALANAIRRTLMDDIPVYRMFVDYAEIGNIVTDDGNILYEDLQGTLHQIVLNQESVTDPEMNLQLIAHNKTTSVMPVTTDHLTHNGAKVAGKLMSRHIILTSLEPGKFLKVQNILLRKNIGRNDGSYQVCPPPGFKCNLKEDESSFTHMPSKFELTIDAIGDFAPKALLKNCMDIIRAKIESTKETLLTRVEEHPVADITNLEVAGETHTMAMLWMFYVLKADPDIAFVAPNVMPDQFTLKLRKEYSNIAPMIKKAYDLMIKDVNIIASALS